MKHACPEPLGPRRQQLFGHLSVVEPWACHQAPTLNSRNNSQKDLAIKGREHGVRESKAQEAQGLPQLFFPDATEALLRKQRRSAVRSKPKPLRKHSIRRGILCGLLLLP